MMETMYDPYDILFGDEQKSQSLEGLLFSNEIMFSDFNTDSSSISPLSSTIDHTETDFDAATFESLVNELFASDPLTLQEQSIDLSFQSEPPTREIGTDPMEPTPSTFPITIQTMNTSPVPTEYFNDQMEDNLPLTPTTSESTDEARSNSPDSLQDNVYSTMLTNLDNLPAIGTLVLTNEEVKLIKQEGYQVPTRLPLNKTEEKILKKIRRKIKNKISAQESRRKKKDYVDALEKQIAKYLDENTSLKRRMATIEKTQISLTQERDLLRSMIGKVTTTPAPSTALMVFAVFFAVLFGIWSPITNKSLTDDRSLSFIPSNNHQSAFPSQKNLIEQQQQETTHSNNYKSRVLLSIDEYDNHHHNHGPYLPSNNKYSSTFQQQTAAPGYTYSNTVEKYMNKKVQSEQFNSNLKRPLIDEEAIYKRIRSNYLVIEETNNEIDNDLNESKPVKIIRVERTVPMIGNDTLKLAHRTINE